MIMNRIIILCVFLLSFNCGKILSQISYGGEPLLLNTSSLRNSFETTFIEMPSFDLDSVLRSDNIQGETRGYKFAHKFHTQIKRGVDGNEIILPDGTKVWQVAIKSEKAYSINLLFTEFDIPEGGKLFIYNTDYSHIIGSFDHRNNNPRKILPTRPVAGDAIIIEYSEPENVDYPGKLTIGEVNHDYVDILDENFLRSEPTIDKPEFACMPDALCTEADANIIRSTVLIITNGNIGCSGTLVNNTKNDQTPYLLTAVHCMHSTSIPVFPQEPQFYEEKAGTIVAFFNYNRQICDSKMKAAEEMSLAITYPRVIIEGKDIALLEFQEKPPLYYNAYYAGWNVEPIGNQPPYTNIHHPAGAVKKYGITKKDLAPVSLGAPFEPSNHWMVESWDEGSTYPGSSGSPLFDKNNLLVGGLSGGFSECINSNPNNQPDAFFALYKGWPDQLKTYLDPLNTGAKKLQGLDPNKKDPFIRIGNAQFNNTDTLRISEYKSPNKGFLFGNSNVKVVEFAEEFNTDFLSTLHGAFLFIPQMPYSQISNVKINVYEGNSTPEKILATQPFRPQYMNYSNTLGFHYRDKNTNSVPTENFIKFDKEINVGKKFFIGYEISYAADNTFAVYNSGSLLENPKNTAWLKQEDGNWITANEYSVMPVSTSLAIQAFLQKREDSSIPSIETDKEKQIVYISDQNQIYLPAQSSGNLYIYSISGQLLQEIVVKNEQYITIKLQQNGTIGIARFIGDNETFTGKFIY